MLTKTKESIAKPKITPAQLLLFGLLMGWIVLTNLKQFSDLNIGIQLSIQIAFYVGIMLTAGAKGNVASLVKSIIGIMVDGENNDIKMLKMQNLIVAMCQELGILYEKERDKFYAYLNDEEKLELKKETLKAEIARLEGV